MPLLASLCLSFTLGVLFARAHAEALHRHERAVQAPGVWLVLAFGIVFWGPALGNVVLSNLAWSLGYWVDPGDISAVLGPALVLAYATLPLLGFLAAASSLMTNRSERSIWLLGVSSAVSLILALAGLPRVLVVGSTHQFRQGYGLEPLAGSSLGTTLVWSAVAFGLVVAWVNQRLRKPETTGTLPGTAVSAAGVRSSK